MFVSKLFDTFAFSVDGIEVLQSMFKLRDWEPYSSVWSYFEIQCRDSRGGVEFFVKSDDANLL